MFASTNRLFQDVLLLIATVFMIIVIIIWPFINPPGKDDAEPLRPPGTLIIEIRWPDNLHTDVDLWVKAPHENSVGYSAKSGRTFNLLRDDLGQTNDTLGLNYENVYSRGIPVGEYQVNVHLYASWDNPPIPVKVKISKRMKNQTVRLFYREVTLKFVGQEITVVRFEMDKNARITDSHNLPRSIRTRP